MNTCICILWVQIHNYTADEGKTLQRILACTGVPYFRLMLLATLSAATVDDTTLDAVGQVNIWQILKLCESKRLLSARRFVFTALYCAFHRATNYRYKRRQSRSTTCDITISAVAVMCSTSISTSQQSYKVFSVSRVCCMHLTRSALVTSQSSAFS